MLTEFFLVAEEVALMIVLILRSFASWAPTVKTNLYAHFLNCVMYICHTK